jgi:hypothetical protein
MTLFTLVVAAQSAFVQAGPSVAFSDADLRQIYKEYGECIVARFPRQASAALLQNIDDQTLIKKKGVLIIGDCLKPPKGVRTSLNLQADRVRYAIADALVRTELSQVGPPDVKSVPALALWDVSQPPSAKSPSGRPLRNADYQAELQEYQEKMAFRAFAIFGECVVRADAASSRSLLATQPETRAEDTAFAQLQGALSACLPAGKKLAFTKQSLRGTIAVNYYRLAKASLAGGGHA